MKSVQGGGSRSFVGLGEREVPAQSNFPAVSSSASPGLAQTSSHWRKKRMVLDAVSCGRGYAFCSLPRHENERRKRQSMK